MINLTKEQISDMMKYTYLNESDHRLTAVVKVADLMKHYEDTEAFTTKLSCAYLKGRMQGRSERRSCAGMWLWVGDGDCIKWSCSRCGRGVKFQENFCPQCGQRMKVERSNNKNG